jgi:hypothetical protein
VIRRGGHFDELVARQLDLFAEDEAELLAEATAADHAWTRASREETEERYGEYQLVVDAIGERLYDLREGYASTLDDDTAEEYRATFNRAATKRFRRFAALLGE